jgi:2-keto-4-pentenoate hydratase
MAPPLLDLLRDDADKSQWVITSVPSDDVSEEQTETITMAKAQCSEAQYIQALLGEIGRLVGSRVTLVSHLGGSNYTLHLQNRSSVTLDALDNATAVEVFDRLRQNAVNAELAFRIDRMAGARHHRPAV